MQRPDEIVDPTGVRQQRRRLAALRFLLPIVLVGSVIGAIGLIAFHSLQVNRTGALRLTRDLLRATGDGVSEKVGSYLAPAVRATSIANDLLAHSNAADRPVAFRAYAASTLREVSSIEAFYLANGSGDFAVISRAAGGGTETGLVQVATSGARSIATEHRDAEGALVDRRADPDDNFDPRQRRWFEGAVAAAGKPFWSHPYLFKPTNRPVITVSMARHDPDGSVHVAAVDVALDELSQFLGSVRIGERGRAAVVDADGHLVAAPELAHGGVDPSKISLDQTRDPVLTGAWDRYRALGAGAREVSQDGIAFVTIAAPLTSGAPGWVLLLGAPEKDFAAFATIGGRQNLLFSLVIVALALLIAALAIRNGLRADRLSRLLAEHRARASEESVALAGLAATPGLFDPRQEALPLTETLAGLAGARRASIWRVAGEGRSLVCEDQFDRAGDGHVGGFALTRDEMPRFFGALGQGDALAVEDATRDTRTAEFHRLAMRDASTRRLAVHPIGGGGGALLGAVMLEDPTAPGRAGNLMRAVAAVAALRFEAGQAREEEFDRGEAADGAVAEDRRAESRVSNLLGSDGPWAEALGGQTSVYPAASVLVLSFADPPASSRRTAAGAVDAADAIARAVQEIGRRYELPYLKIVGHGLIAACGLTEEGDARAAFRLAEAALALRGACLEATEQAGLEAFFSVGLDVGRVVGRVLGEDPGVFNLWGEAVRGAELMAQTASDPGTVQVTESAYAVLRSRYLLRQRGRFFMPRVGVARSFVLAGPR